MAEGHTGHRQAMGDDNGRRAVVLDVDGTLLDSSYHHAIAWSRAFQGVGVSVPVWRIHRAIGMGGDKLVAAVAGNDVEEADGDELRERWEKEYDDLIEETRLFSGAKELLSSLRGRGLAVALASSSIPAHAQHAFDLLDADRLADTATTAEDAEESKPDPELIEEALSRLGTRCGCVVGDSVYDIEAASAAGVASYGVLTGGYGRAELLDAGARNVYEDLDDLRAHVDEWAPV